MVYRQFIMIPVVLIDATNHGLNESYSPWTNYVNKCIPGGGAVIFEMDTGVRPALRQAGAFGESTGSKNEGSLGERMIFGIQ